MSNKPLSDDEKIRLAGLIGVYLVSLAITAFLHDSHAKAPIAGAVLAAVFAARALLEIPAALLTIGEEMAEELGPYFFYLALGLPLLGFGLAAWAGLKPNGPWSAADGAVRILSVLFPLVMWTIVRANAQAVPEEPKPILRVTPVPPAPPAPYVPPPPRPIPPLEPTPEEKELARIDAEAKEFNLPVDLVEAQKDRTRAEFGSRNGNH